MKRRDIRRPGPGPYLLGLKWVRGPVEGEFPFDVPAVAAIEQMDLSAPVTLLAGDNGTGKSTLIEAFAEAIGFAPEGGELERAGELPPVPRPVLENQLEPVLERWSKPRNGYFLRAESFFNVAAFVDSEGTFSPDLSLYGDTPLHQQSHGESFLALATNRFAGEGLYILDEPEAALSVTGALAVLAAIDRAAKGGAQFIIATHSPILLACPGARIYELDEDGFREMRLRRPRRRAPHPRLPRRPRALPQGRARLSRSTASAARAVPPCARTVSRSSRARGAHASAAATASRTPRLAQLDARADRLELGGVGELVDGLRDRDGRDAEPQRLARAAHAGVGDEDVGVRQNVELRLGARGEHAREARRVDLAGGQDEPEVRSASSSTIRS